MRKLAIVAEVHAVFLLVMAIIWFLDGKGILVWLAALVPFSIVTWRWKRISDELKLKEEKIGIWQVLGIVPENLTKDIFAIFIVFIFLWRVVMNVAEQWNSDEIERVDTLKVLLHALVYFGWAWFQQLCCNGYFTNRIADVTNNKMAVSLWVGLLFGLVHLPNPVLVPVTVIGGAISSYFFQRNKNLWWLAMGHALLAVTIHHFLPRAWHHGMTIGPKFW